MATLKAFLLKLSQQKTPQEGVGTSSALANSSLQISPPLNEDRSSPPSSPIGSHLSPLEGSPTILSILSPIFPLENSPAFLPLSKHIPVTETHFPMDVLAPCPFVPLTLPEASQATCPSDNSSTEVLSSSSGDFSPPRGTVANPNAVILFSKPDHGEVSSASLPSPSVSVRDLQIINKEKLQPHLEGMRH